MAKATEKKFRKMNVREDLAQIIDKQSRHPHDKGAILDEHIRSSMRRRGLLPKVAPANQTSVQS